MCYRRTTAVAFVDPPGSECVLLFGFKNDRPSRATTPTRIAMVTIFINLFLADKLTIAVLIGALLIAVVLKGSLYK